MRKVKNEIVQGFVGKIGDETLYDEGLYTTTVYLVVEKLCNKLKDITIPKENDLVKDLINSIGNMYKYKDITLADISDAIESCIESFDPKTKKLNDLEFYMFDSFIDKEITDKYLGFINDRLKSGYYLTE